MISIMIATRYVKVTATLRYAVWGGALSEGIKGTTRKVNVHLKAKRDSYLQTSSLLLHR